ncbi:hypothetical protein MsAg5_04490 [Methanosarcinaceae archaeon Ag5]|uniref:Uncharacterized protein n=1 Tax=Methanolapillus africanus TaxID=3028297 RepID=A0AAE4SDH2_9EURY|nr:hypothetical protein [Methanosarcinaceae archaeon Ag5]
MFEDINFTISIIQLAIGLVSLAAALIPVFYSVTNNLIPEKNKWKPQFNIWNSFLCENKNVNDCFEKFENIEKESNSTNGLFFGISLFVSILAISLGGYIKLILYFEKHTNDVKETMATVYLIILIVFLLITFLIMFDSIFKISKIKNQDNLENTNKSNDLIIENYAAKKIDISYRMWILLGLIVSSFYILYLAVKLPNLLFNLIFVMSFLLLIVTNALVMIIVYRLKKSYEKIVKNHVNKECFETYPSIAIERQGEVTIIGKVENVFENNKVVIITDEGKKIIKWSSITSLKEVK